MQSVSNVTQFDEELEKYIKGSYVKKKYIEYLGCKDANLTDTDDYYARYTTSSICNGIVQSSKNDCTLSSEESRPLCADDCALMARSEQQILVNPDLCPQRDGNYMDQIRSDFTEQITSPKSVDFVQIWWDCAGIAQGVLLIPQTPAV
ncbi:hypothetical protein EYZ11_000728 [Aspergillus tanneri]|uniref:Uncharacterized protein n=1 Tax=Aspergillus tanneri TaxID=1220188 RepID=A0A4S3JWF0_9EURO|nr:hypothetical protein EYZ11_000728 [Aspergillus tanneri]